MSNRIIDTVNKRKTEAIIDSYATSLISLSADIVIKQNTQAQKYETIESSENFDTLYQVKHELDTFKTYHYIYAEMYEAGMTNDEIEKYINNQDEIPIKYQDKLLNIRRKYIIDTYVEKNRYYRILYGLPGDDKEIIHLEGFIYDGMDIDGIDISKPIHEMTNDEILRVEKAGILDNIKAKYPNRLYLNHLGSKKIDPYEARVANPMAIIYTPYGIDQNLLTSFKSAYQATCAYTRRVVYNKGLEIYEHYEAILIIMTILLTVKKVLAEYVTIVIDKDFFNTDVIRNVFYSYGIDTFETIPLEYRSILARNVNQILIDKGSDKVLYDICNLFGFKDIEIFKLYLFKEHKKHADGSYIFREKDIINPITGVIEEVVPDVEEMYNLYFLKTPLSSSTPSDYINNPDNIVSYEEITERDKYWGNGVDKADLKVKILNEDFNFIETKYISLNTMYNLTELFMELNYFLRMLIDNKNKLNVNVIIPTLSTSAVSLFNAIVALFALTSAKNGFDGNVMDTPTKAMSVLGFNFSADIPKLARILKGTKYESTLQQFKQMPMNAKSADILNTYFSNIDLIKEYKKIMATTCSYSDYSKLKKVHDALAYCENNRSMFTMKNGELAKTYLEYLKSSDFNVFTSVNDIIKTNDITMYIDNISDITSALDELLYSDRFKFLFSNMSPSIIETVKTYLLKVIEFFKSYTTDLDNINTYYILGIPDAPEIRLFDVISKEVSTAMNTNIPTNMNDTIVFTDVDKIINDNIRLKESEGVILYYTKRKILDIPENETMNEDEEEESIR